MLSTSSVLVLPTTMSLLLASVLFIALLSQAQSLCGDLSCKTRPLGECDFSISDCVYLKLESKQLSGTIPASLGSLIHVDGLNLANNALTGTIPSSLCAMTNFRELTLYGNYYLTGTVPSCLYAALHLLDIHNCPGLTGTLPTILPTLPGREFFPTDWKFDHTALSGQMPSWIGQAPYLTVFTFDHSGLSGTLPASFCSVETHMSTCQLQNVEFSCPFPEACTDFVTYGCGAECAFDLDAGGWSQWTECTQSCNGGSQTRQFILFQDNSSSGEQTQQCNTGECPEDCTGAWSAWSACSASCVNGTQSRLYNVLSDPINGGAACAENDGEWSTRDCVSAVTPFECVDAWSVHASCTACENSNLATGLASVVAGGFSNTAASAYSVVSGGEHNRATGMNAVVAGGFSNTAASAYSVVSGGEHNRVTGMNAVVAGGSSNTAIGNNSFVVGRLAVAADNGAAVFGFQSEDGNRSKCTSQGHGTVHLCVDNGVFVNGVLLNMSVFSETWVPEHLFEALQLRVQHMNATLTKYQRLIQIQSGLIDDLTAAKDGLSSAVTEMHGSIEVLEQANGELNATARSQTASISALNSTVDVQRKLIESVLERLVQLESASSFVSTWAVDPCADLTGEEVVECHSTVAVTISAVVVTKAASTSLGWEDQSSSAETNDVVLISAISAVGAFVLAVGIGVTVWCCCRRSTLRDHLAKYGNTAEKVVTIPMVEIGGGAVGAGRAAELPEDQAHFSSDRILDSITGLLRTDTTLWTFVHRLADKVLAFRKFVNDLESDIGSERVQPEPVRLAESILGTSLAENRLLMDHAAKARDFSTASRYSERVRLLESVLGSKRQVQLALECVLPGLLLRQDRFEQGSDAFLGRGASASVSKGIWVDGEVRVAVAVKEIAKSGSTHEASAVSEFHLLSQRLGRHNNIVRILNVKVTFSTVYLIMECCAFSLDKQPKEFLAFLHCKEAQAVLMARFVLNALVQDLLVGVSFLHSKGVAHCDVKVRTCGNGVEFAAALLA